MKKRSYKRMNTSLLKIPPKRYKKCKSYKWHEAHSFYPEDFKQKGNNKAKTNVTKILTGKINNK